MSVARRLVGLAVLLAAVTAAGARDPEAAAREYRIARRLAAERSDQAEAALRRVIELDPDGPLGDEARVDLALLLGAPGTVRDLGRITERARDEAMALLEPAAARGAERSGEARLRGALLLLEPLAGRDVVAARLALISVAADPEAGPLSDIARDAVAWIDAAEGRLDPAASTWQRILVDSADAARRAAAADGLANVHRRRARFESAVDVLARTPGSSGVLLEAAVRDALRTVDPRTAWMPARAISAVPAAPRGTSAILRLPDGSTVIADRREDRVVRHGADGRVDRWTVAGPSALALDPYGRTWVAGSDRVARLGESGALQDVREGRFSQVAALAVDPGGAVYLLDRRGSRIARLGPAAREPVDWWEDSSARLLGLAREGGALVSVDERAGTVVRIDEEGRARGIAVEGLERPSAFALDAAGQVVVLDGKRDEIVLVAPSGRVRDRLSIADIGVSRPGTVAVGPDGSLDVLDVGTGRIVRLP